MKKSTFYISFLLIGLAALLRFFKLDFQSLWLDELYTSAFTNPHLSLSYIFSTWLFADTHPPLYYLLLREWQILAGESVIALRLPSALMGFLTILASWSLFPKKHEFLTKIIFTGLMSCSYAAFYFSQEARMYSLLLFLAVCLTLMSISIINSLNDEEPLDRKKILLFFLCSAIACFTHYFGVLLFAILSLCLLAYSLKSGSKYKLGYFRNILTFSFVIGTAVLVWLYVYYIHGIPQASGWYFNQHKSGLFNFLIDFSFSASKKYSFGFIFLLCLLGLIKSEKLYYFSPSFVIPVIVMASSIAFGLLVSLKINLMLTRYFIVILPSFLMVISVLITYLIKSSSKLEWALPALFAVMIWENILPNFSDPFQKGRIKSACDYIISHSKEGDVVYYSATFFNWEMTPVFNYYLTHNEKKIRLCPINELNAGKARNQSVKIVWIPYRNKEEIKNVNKTCNLNNFKTINFSNNYVLIANR